MVHDALRQTWDALTVRKDPDCAVCGAAPTVTELVDYEVFCGVGAGRGLARGRRPSRRASSPARSRDRARDRPLRRWSTCGSRTSAPSSASPAPSRCTWTSSARAPRGDRCPSTTPSSCTASPAPARPRRCASCSTPATPTRAPRRRRAGLGARRRPEPARLLTVTPLPDYEEAVLEVVEPSRTGGVMTYGDVAEIRGRQGAAAGRLGDVALRRRDDLVAGRTGRRVTRLAGLAGRGAGPLAGGGRPRWSAARSGRAGRHAPAPAGTAPAGGGAVGGV